MNAPASALILLVILHVLVALVHGRAHSGAGVVLGPAAMTFVWLVIMAGPLVGLAVAGWAPAPGAWIVAACMAGAFAFGLVNHFIIDSADHVSQVRPPWQMLFGTTAVLLAVIEALGSGVGVWNALAAPRRVS